MVSDCRQIGRGESRSQKSGEPKEKKKKKTAKFAVMNYRARLITHDDTIASFRFISFVICVIRRGLITASYLYRIKINKESEREKRAAALIRGSRFSASRTTSGINYTREPLFSSA